MVRARAVLRDPSIHPIYQPGMIPIPVARDLADPIRAIQTVQTLDNFHCSKQYKRCAISSF